MSHICNMYMPVKIYIGVNTLYVILLPFQTTIVKSQQFYCVHFHSTLINTITFCCQEVARKKQCIYPVI